MGLLSDLWNSFKEGWTLPHDEWMAKMERENPGFTERLDAQKKREASLGQRAAKRRGYVDPAISQDLSDPAVMATKLYRAGAIDAGTAAHSGAPISAAELNRPRRD